jgi:hypothetical protein
MSRTDTNQVAAELLSRDTGGFAAANLSTTHGDWAANVMERLNGIAWWGNVNHNWHGGHGFAAYMDFGYTFFSGRSLGESILQAKRTEDGLRYGDPLYRPMGVKISTHLPGRSTKSRGLVPRHLSQTERYTVTAFQGRQDTPWKLSACWRDLGASSVSPCAESRVLMRGTRAVEDFDTGIAMASLVRDDRRSEMVELTLELGNPEDPQSIFVDRASFGYWALHPGGVVPYVEPTQ